jgi:hypothetical protein
MKEKNYQYIKSMNKAFAADAALEGLQRAMPL